MKRTIKLTERNLTNIVKRIISEQAVDEKTNLIQVLTDKLESMKSNPQFTADDVCETIINNCNHFKNKTDIFAQTTKINEEKSFNPSKVLGMIKTATKNNKIELAITLGEDIVDDVNGMKEVITHLKKGLSEIDKAKDKLKRIDVSK
jgi:hypothetical protein